MRKVLCCACPRVPETRVNPAKPAATNVLLFISLSVVSGRRGALEPDTASRNAAGFHRSDHKLRLFDTGRARHYPATLLYGPQADEHRSRASGTPVPAPAPA